MKELLKKKKYGAIYLRIIKYSIHKNVNKNLIIWGGGKFGWSESFNEHPLVNSRQSEKPSYNCFFFSFLKVAGISL
jgi:hypothetical protein